MTRFHRSTLAALTLSIPLLAQAADPASCSTVSFSNIGWTDIEVTTASATAVLEALGYQTKTTLLAVPVTFRSMENRQVDLFLGNWMPSGAPGIEPYLKRGALRSVRANLEGAKYTLAVPDYVYDGGVKDFADIAKHAKEFGGKVYGIQPGGDGNKHIQAMIEQNQFGMGRFRLIESSEAGMLSQVARAVKRKEWIVFLGWEPHPMNTHFKLKYLTGGDEIFGPNFGGATVYTIERKGYSQECPNVGKFISNLAFTLPMENEMMDGVLNGHQKPAEAATAWIAKHPGVLDKWLEGVTTRDGQPGLAVVKAKLVK